MLQLEERPYLWLGRGEARHEVGPGKRFATIQSAIDYASDGDVIWVEAGTYRENLSFRSKDLTLIGKAGPRVTILDGRGCTSGPDTCSAVIFPPGSRGWFEGFTLIGGTGTTWIDGDPSRHDPWSGHGTRAEAPRVGGAALVVGSAPVIARCILKDGKATYGGGLAVLGSRASLTHDPTSALRNARRGSSEGLELSPPPPLPIISLVEVQVINNEARVGGGIYLDEATLSLSGGRISGNSATRGGGIAQIGGELFATLIELLKNKATDEGGTVMAVRGARVSLVQTALVEGSAAEGALVYTSNSSVIIENTWLSFPRRSAGVHADGNSRVVVTASMVWAGEEAMYGGSADKIQVGGDVAERNPRFYSLSQRRTWDEDDLGAWRRGEPSAIETLQVGLVDSVKEVRTILGNDEEAPTEEALDDSGDNPGEPTLEDAPALDKPEGVAAPEVAPLPVAPAPAADKGIEPPAPELTAPELPTGGLWGPAVPPPSR